MAQAYGYQGWLEFWGGMFGYFVVFNDFGFPPSSLLNIANVNIFNSNSSDVYNPTSKFFGNSLLEAQYATDATKCPPK
jgi:sodium/potassium-transporting ATPase subunit alpha